MDGGRPGKWATVLKNKEQRILELHVNEGVEIFRVAL